MRMNSKGFTLIEMLIVVAIIAILVAVSIPMMNGALEDSRKSTDMANMRSAKGWAQMDFMKGNDAGIFKDANKDATSGNYVGYYDAVNGVCVAPSDQSKVKGYGQTKAKHADAGITTDDGAQGKVIKVEIDPDGDTAANEPPGAVTLTWVASTYAPPAAPTT